MSRPWKMSDINYLRANADTPVEVQCEVLGRTMFAVRHARWKYRIVGRRYGKIETKSKVCSTCEVRRKLRNFYADRQRLDGKRSQCKECTKRTVTRSRKKRRKQLFQISIK